MTTTAAETGIYYDLPFDQYAASAGLNASALSEGRKSMKHLRYALTHPTKETEAMRFGRIVHAAVFEYDTFLERFAIWRGGRRQSKEWEQFKEDVAPAEPIKIEDAEKALEAGKAAVNHGLVTPLIAEGAAEVSIWWHDHGELCKGRLDWIANSDGKPWAIADLKTATNIKQHEFGQQFARLGYHLRLGWYRRGIRIRTGYDLPVYLIVLESNPPYDVVRVPVPEAVLDHGEKEAVMLLQRVQWCREQGRWPGIAEDDDYPLHFPEWAMPDEEVTFNG